MNDDFLKLVVIVGGGFTGLFTALHLRHQSIHKVRVYTSRLYLKSTLNIKMSNYETCIKAIATRFLTQI